MPKISVIIPIYGVERYIERCARSLFEQTMRDIEFIFIDDCTPDHSMEILREVIEEYQYRLTEDGKIVRIVKMPENSGLAAVRRYGIQLATGDYVIHCDSDDWVDANMFQEMYSKAVEENADVVVCDYYSTDGETFNITYKGCRTNRIEQFKRDVMLQNASWAVWNKLFRRTLYNDIISYPEGNMGEDMVLVIQLLFFCRNISFLPKPLYYYFVNSSSITRTVSVSTTLTKFSQFKDNYELIESFLIERGEDSFYERELNWLRYSVRSILFVKEVKCQIIRKKVYPFIEFKVLFYPEIDRSKRVVCLKNIVKQLLGII